MTSTATTELFLFLTPHIIESDADADRLRDDVERQTKWLRDEKAAIIRPPTIPPAA
jgi:type II secretory pathway component GspD/PulD (secretin)